MKKTFMILIVFIISCTKNTNINNNITPVTKPVLTTNPINNISNVIAFGGGTFITDGESNISSKGVCWSTNNNPTINDFKSDDGNGVTNYSSVLTGLSPNTTYYVKAFAINSIGIGYGNEVSFTTNTIATVTDIDGNDYKTVTIGSQVWMVENLKVSKYRDGTTIPNVTDGTQWKNLTSGAYCYYNNNSSFNITYGKLYNWYAVNNSKNIAPTGWHVPTDTEWQTLVDYLGGYTIAGGSLKSTDLWNSPNTGANNSSGFTAIPGCVRNYEGGYDFFGGNTNIGMVAAFWSSTERDSYTAFGRTMNFNSSSIYQDMDGKTAWFSVRCIKD